jgi:hypothetical protein
MSSGVTLSAPSRNVPTYNNLRFHEIHDLQGFYVPQPRSHPVWLCLSDLPVRSLALTRSRTLHLTLSLIREAFDVVGISCVTPSYAIFGTTLERPEKTPSAAFEHRRDVPSVLAHPGRTQLLLVSSPALSLSSDPAS